MNYSSAKKVSPRLPCTNIPIQCTLCPADENGERTTTWKYNTWIHIATAHADPVDLWKVPDIPYSLQFAMHVLKKEEHILGISDEAAETYREENEVPATSDIKEMEDLDEVIAAEGKKKCRGNSDSL